MTITIDGLHTIQTYSDGSEVRFLTEATPTLPNVNILAPSTVAGLGAVALNIETALPDGDYDIPYHVEGVTRKFIKRVSVLNGTGAISFTFAESGVYYILNSDLHLTNLQVNGTDAQRFSVTVYE